MPTQAPYNRLAQNLAVRFSTKTILEPQHMSLLDGYDWCLVTEDRQLYAVAVAERDDGLALRLDVPSIQLGSYLCARFAKPLPTPPARPSRHAARASAFPTTTSHCARRPGC